jgi:arginyl-tRNA synthetase
MLTEIRAKLSTAIAKFASEKGVLNSVALAIEAPKDPSHGDLAVPVFSLAKHLRQAPPVVAEALAQYLRTQGIQGLEGASVIQGFVNLKLSDSYRLAIVLHEVLERQNRVGHSDQGRGQTVAIDYSSPNVAKPMHVGHLRATVIGQSIRNLAESQGYKVIGINHLGDWGSQFGKLCFAYERWGSEFDFAGKPFESLYGLYIKFHAEVEKDPELEKEGARFFKRLEDGDLGVVALWKRFIEISMADFAKNWARLGVQHDLVLGESFYNDKMEPVVQELLEKGLLKLSEGAQIVDLESEGLPPCLIRKSDGASLYATRDLATAIYRMETLKADLNLYVVGADQALHFKQVFAVLKKMGRTWVDRCHHIGFGLVRFKDSGKISSRKGNIIRFSDIFDRAVDIVSQVMAEKNPDLKGAEVKTVAEQVAVGAIIFNDLVNERVKNVEFDWDRALSFDGDAGPYVQYVYVRCRSLLAKAALEESPLKYTPPQNFEFASDEERLLNRTLLFYPDALSGAFKSFKPNIVANYLLDICAAFNRFYHQHKILSAEGELRAVRLAQVAATALVIESGLGILNMPRPEKM